MPAANVITVVSRRTPMPWWRSSNVSALIRPDAEALDVAVAVDAGQNEFSARVDLRFPCRGPRRSPPPPCRGCRHRPSWCRSRSRPCRRGSQVEGLHCLPVTGRRARARPESMATAGLYCTMLSQWCSWILICSRRAPNDVENSCRAPTRIVRTQRSGDARHRRGGALPRGRATSCARPRRRAVRHRDGGARGKRRAVAAGWSS